MDRRSKQLGEEKIETLLVKFSVPAIVGMLVNALYNVVDRMFVGRGVGSLAIAGITIAFPVMIIQMAFAMLIGLGATALVSIKLGEDRHDEAEHITTNALVLLIIVMSALGIIGLAFQEPILKFFGASADVLPYAKDYLGIILFASVFYGVGFGMNNIIRAEGNPKTAMFTMLIGAITNTILDYIFIFILDMGIQGAALATVIAQTVSAIWVVSYFVGGKSSLKIKKENIKIRKHIAIKIFSIGSPAFMRQIATSVVLLILNNRLIAFGGDVAISALGVINSISTIILMPIFGINQGSQPIIGYNYGSKQFDRVKKALWYAVGAATILVIVGFVLIIAIPEQLIALFAGNDQELIDIGANGLQVFFAAMPLIGAQIICSNYFQAVGKSKQAAFLSLSRQVIFLIPAALILPEFFGLNGVWVSAPVSDVLSFIVTGIWIFREMKTLSLEIRQNNSNKTLYEK